MNKKHLTISALALILMSACTDSALTGVEPDALAGTWTATSIIITSVANPTLSTEEVAEGAALTLTLGPDVSYIFAFTFPGEPDENETGTYTVNGSTFTTTPVEGIPEEFTIERDGDTMTLTGEDMSDFGGEGNEEAATVVITLTR